MNTIFYFLTILSIMTQAAIVAPLAVPLPPLPEQEYDRIFLADKHQEKPPVKLLHQGLFAKHTYIRARSASLLGEHGNRASIPYLIDTLSDQSIHIGADYPDPGMATTRYWANKSLKKLTGKDFGFAWNDSEEKRNKSIEKWIKWFQDGQKTFSRATFIAHKCEHEPKWHVAVYENQDYHFVYRHYGNAEYVPGFFVFSKKHNRWLEITKLSTENAKLGHSPPFEEVPLSVVWNYSSLKDKDYAKLPLRTSGSIAFPEEIRYDVRCGAYHLIFGRSLKVEYQTWFWIYEKDLEKAFAS